MIDFFSKIQAFEIAHRLTPLAKNIFISKQKKITLNTLTQGTAVLKSSTSKVCMCW